MKLNRDPCTLSAMFFGAWSMTMCVGDAVALMLAGVAGFGFIIFAFLAIEKD